MVNFYHCAVESVLTYGLLAWFAACTSAEKEALHRVVRAAGKIIGVVLPDIQTVYTSRCMKRVKNILQDHLHPAHHLFQLLPSRRRYRSIRAKTSRLANSLYPHAVRIVFWGPRAPSLPFPPLRCEPTERCRKPSRVPPSPPPSPSSPASPAPPARCQVSQRDASRPVGVSVSPGARRPADPGPAGSTTS
ncbi:hypothetical protein EPR50_G00228620 [Perca flavescens]|uniref:Alkylated DNA repair protein AlkB homologue 8 N-terminal domain-containing protein n=1 Tax=Perca flavescens TaxID=8167 RepID=A0A484C380_PERFV|nr:hypothetical protein EPR50_G00228620 [Perca flavescens]